MARKRGAELGTTRPEHSTEVWQMQMQMHPPLYFANLDVQTAKDTAM
tara:strand:+ start:1336 stop:1476 length:141 start_codon:yes stop_codon:yes gene_type:complete